jgi:uncharacterized protein YkwD
MATASRLPLIKPGLTLILLFVGGAVALAAETAPLQNNSEPPKVFTEHTAETFRQLEQAQEKIDFDKIDFDLLSAAVFHETNKRREKEKLPPLRDHAKLREVALMQATIMARRGSISHVNPALPEKETPRMRFQLAGLKPAFGAENVATAFGLNYKEDEPVYIREGNGKKIFSREPDGQPIEMHTYVSFAEALLDSWMASPHHRENIVSTKAELLGASCQPKTNDIGMPMFYCAQEFYTPLREPAPPP